MKIELKRGNDLNLKATVTKDGAAVDVTDWSLRLTVKQNPTDPDSEAIINKLIDTMPNPELGIINIPIDADDTEDKDVGVYQFDVQVMDASGKKHSSGTGVFTIIQEITDEV